MTLEFKEKIVRNSARCRRCGDKIESMSQHDFKWCLCRTIAVDGGHAYIRRVGVHDVIDTSIVIHAASDVHDVQAQMLSELDRQPSHYRTLPLTAESWLDMKTQAQIEYEAEVGRLSIEEKADLETVRRREIGM